jgi:CRP-like cAMP-binding protein
MGPGELFGELALLRDTPRNATVVAAGPGLLLALDRADFLAAVTGHARAREAADALIRERSDRGEPRFDGRADGGRERRRAERELAHGGGRQHEEA